MKFGSWTHKGKALNYSFYKNRDKLDLADYLKSGSWDIIDCPGEIKPYTDDYSGDQKEQIIFYFVLRRKTLFYTVNLIIPCVLISFVTVYVFALPADAGEKMALCISLLLALVVFLLLVSKILPPSLTIPLIAKYLLFTFIMNLIAILSTVIIINRSYRTPRTHSMPHWVRVVFLKELPKYLLMTRPDHDRKWQDTSTPAPSIQSTPETRRVNLIFSRNLNEFSEIHGPHCQLNSTASLEHHYSNTHNRPVPGGSLMEESSHQDSEDTVEMMMMTPELRKTVDCVKFMYEHLKREQEYETVGPIPFIVCYPEEFFSFM